MLCLIFVSPESTRVEKVLHTRDSRLAGLLSCVEHGFPVRVAISQEISEPFIPSCEFGNVVVALVVFPDVLHVDGLQLVRVVELTFPFALL